MTKENIRKQKTKKVLEKTLLELLKRKDLNEIKIIDLTNKAGISRRTFYRHYELIEELFTDSVCDLFMDITDTSYALFEEAWDGKGDKVLYTHINQFRAYYEYWDELVIVFSIADKDLIIDNIHKQYEMGYLKSGKLDYEPPDKSSFQYMYIRYHAGALYMILKEWFTTHKDKSPEEIARIYTKIKADPSYNFDMD